VTMKNAALAIFVFGSVGVVGCAATSTTDAPAPAQTAAASASKDATGMSQDRVIHFAFDSSTIDAANREIIDAYGRFLAANPTLSIKLEGHADERGTREYNLALGERRANSIAQALRTMGITNNRISIASYGEDRPVADGHTEQAWAQNRRGVIIQ
jgi:peptidoglycan-associated lipoprotein